MKATRPAAVWPTILDSSRSVIGRLSRALRSGALTPQRLRAAALSNCRQRAELNAFCSLATEAEVGAGPPEVSMADHPLFGLPIAVKDNFCTARLPTTCGSPALATNFAPTYNATAVQRLLDCGALLLGKTNLDPFGMGSGCVDGLQGPVRNPWTQRSDLAKAGGADFYVAGGSSGGSAAAVAAGLVVGALASDTGGSARIPAAFCGVVGFKPTYGLVSRHGLVPLVNALDCVSVLANSVADACCLLNAVSGPDVWDPTCRGGGKGSVTCEFSGGRSASSWRIGVPQEFSTPGMSQSVLDAWSGAVGHLESDLGASCSAVSLPHTRLSIKTYSVLCCAEVASNMARYDGIEFGLRLPPESVSGGNSVEALFTANRLAGFNSVIRSRILAGNYFLLRRNYQAYYEQARRVWRLIKADFDRVFQSVDVLVCPVTATAALPYAEFARRDNRYRTSTMDLCTQSVNLAGLPAIVIPVGLEPGTGLPLSVQVIGPPNADSLVASVAASLEAWAGFPALAGTCEHSLLRLLD